MRIGNNPLRNTTAPTRNPSMVAAVIMHLPTMTGYHSERFDVVRLCLASMRAGCNAPVMVWDNGSCDTVRIWLTEEYKPDYLMLSPNIGKQSARANIMHMFPPHTVIGISDDDMLFYPGWLDKSVKVLNHFPNVGLVSAYPVRTQFRWGCSNTIKWAKDNPKASLGVGRFIDPQWDMDFCTSIGRDYNQHVENCNIQHDLEYLITFNGLQAYATGHHCQFVGYNDRLARFCVWNDTAMGEEKTFDASVDNAKLLRLTTTERLARHIGNIIDPGVREDAVKMGILEAT